MIDPKTSMWINIVIAVLGVVAGATSYFTDLFGVDTSKVIVGTAGFALAVFGAVNIALHGASSDKPGPLA